MDNTTIPAIPYHGTHRLLRGIREYWERTYFGHMPAIGLIGVLALALFYTTPTNGDFWWFDSARHAMNGIFVRDFFADGGLLHPIDFATAYYQKYPAINIGFYPPFFYITSAPFLAVFGQTHAVAQAVVAMYTFACGLLVYAICLTQMGKTSALAVAVSMLVIPDMALWSRQVQLDIPAVTLLLATAYCLIRHVKKPSTITMFLAALLCGLSILTRVQAIFSLGVLFFFLLCYRYDNRPSLERRILACSLGFLLALPSIVLFLYFSAVNTPLSTAMPGMPKLLTAENWTWYAERLLDQVGPHGMCVIGLGLLAALYLTAKKRLTPPLLITSVFWVVSWLLFTIISNKDPRFNLPSIVFLFLFSSISLSVLLREISVPILVIIATFLTLQVFNGSTIATVNGFEKAALVVQKIAPLKTNVLICAHRDGNFIFNLRTNGQRRDIGTIRADKRLVEVNIMSEFGIKENNLSEKQIRSMLMKEKISAIVVELGYLQEQPSIKNLYKFLGSETDFRLLEKIRLKDTGPSGRNGYLYVYTRV